MSCSRSLSRDSLTGKTTSAKARIIENSTQNQLYFKKQTRLSGLAMSELSNGTKKYTSKSRETIPLRITHKRLSVCPVAESLERKCDFEPGTGHKFVCLKGQSHEKVGELRVWRGSLGPN
jgi:hypothetical protein